MAGDDTDQGSSRGAGARRRRWWCLAAGVVVAGLCSRSVIWSTSVDDGGEEEQSPETSYADSLEMAGLNRSARAPANDVDRRWSEIPLYRPEQDLVFFSHIHKTSGTSLRHVISLLANVFPRTAVVPTSHPSKGLQVSQLQGHDSEWWQPFQLMFSHNRANVTDTIGIPPTKTPRVLITIRNPLLHKASIFFESVCRFGKHISDNGTIDQEAATLARVNGSGVDTEQYNFCRDPEMWVGSKQFDKVYRNFEARWLSYGAAEGHPCIRPDPEFNRWRVDDTDVGGTCKAIKASGQDADVWAAYFERTADAAIRRMEGALWVGVTERMEESLCLLFLTLGKKESEMPQHRLKIPRPITVWHDKAKEKAASYDRADWRVFEAANDFLDLRLWTARERLKGAGDEERARLGDHCFQVLAGTGGSGGE
ncbi:unnamed protein product [Ectocarpus sp. 6 AP-2014]